jgi:hypothetical protein
MTYKDAWVLQRMRRMKYQIIRDSLFPTRFPDAPECVVIYTNDVIWAPSDGAEDGGTVIPFPGKTAASQ